MKLIGLIFLFTIFSYFAFGDTPPPGTVKAKMFTGDGSTAITATGTALNVNVTNSSGLSTVDQGAAGAQSWLMSVTGSVLPTGAATETSLLGVNTNLAAVLAKMPTLIGGNVPVAVQGTVAVSGAYQATQPVSGSLGRSWTLSNGTDSVAISGTVTATNSANGTTGLAVPAQTTQVGGSDGTNLRALKVSSTGVLSVDGSASTQPVSAASLPLPSGAATAANQTTLITALGSPFQAGGSIGNSAFGISGTLPAYASTPTFNLGTLNGAATDAELVTINTTLGSPFQAGASIGNTAFGISGTLPAFAATPTFNLGTLNGAATATNQSTANTSLASIDTKTPALGQALAAGSVPVVLTAAQISTLTPLSSVAVTQATGTNLHTVVDSGAVTATISGTPNVAVTSSALPTGAATSALQSTGNTSLSSIDGKVPALGQALAAGSVPVVLPTAQITTLTPLSSVTVTQGTGTNLHTVVDSSGLPTGASTSALQTTANTSLSSIDTKTPALGQALAASSVPVVMTASQLSTLTPLSSVTVTQATGTNLHTVVDSAPTTAVTQSGTWTVTSTHVGGASGSQTTGTVSTVITLTAPANAQGFLLQNLGTSTANLRFAIGATATTTLGMQLAPGQDSGYVPAGANVTLVAESGTQNYNVQWVVK